MTKRSHLRLVSVSHGRHGMALLSVVIVLSTLLTLGVLFAMTVELDLKANRYFRETGRTRVMALEGLHRAMAELQYDQWGVNEERAFKLADSTAAMMSAAQLGDGGGAAAYFRTADDTPILAPRSKWRRSVEKLTHEADGTLNVLTDYRWLVHKDDLATISPEAYAPSDISTAVYQHSGANYHDEFLPEGIDNYDHWELALHANNGNLYYGYSAWFWPDWKPAGASSSYSAKSRALIWDGEGRMGVAHGVYGGRYWISGTHPSTGTTY